MATGTAAKVAAPAAAALVAACVRHVTAPPWTPPPATPNTTTITTVPWTAPAMGPSSALAQIRLPAGSTLVASHPLTYALEGANNPDAPLGPSKWRESDEVWHYVVSYDAAVRAMSYELGHQVRMPDGSSLNRCREPTTTSDMHEWVFVGAGMSIEVIVQPPGSPSSTGGPTPDGQRISIVYRSPGDCTP